MRCLYNEFEHCALGRSPHKLKDICCVENHTNLQLQLNSNDGVLKQVQEMKEQRLNTALNRDWNQ